MVTRMIRHSSDDGGYGYDDGYAMARWWWIWDDGWMLMMVVKLPNAGWLPWLMMVMIDDD